VDFAEAAIERTKTKNFVNAEFIIADVESFCPTRKYDIIVFAESLYYMKNQILILKRYKEYLKENGTN